MNKQLYAILLLGLLAVAAQGQSPAPGAPPAPAVAIPARPPKIARAELVANDAPKLTRFNLNFPGGNPQQLVAAIEKAAGRSLNVVIPDEYADERIPALRMTQVTAPDLFRAMEQASMKLIAYHNPVHGYGSQNTSISFQTSGPVSDDSIWYFHGRQQPPEFSSLESKPAPAKISRFYALTPYLEQGLKVEDITTAIQTGWKMLGEKEAPSISFHKETKLLIAVGEPGKLETIDAVLKALNQKTAIDPATGLPVPQGGSFSDRIQSIIQRAAPPAGAPAKTNAAVPKPIPAAETEP